MQTVARHVYTGKHRHLAWPGQKSAIMQGKHVRCSITTHRPGKLKLTMILLGSAQELSQSSGVS